MDNQRTQDQVAALKPVSDTHQTATLVSKMKKAWGDLDLKQVGKLALLALGLIAKWVFGADRVLERLSMYERRFEASLFKTMVLERITMDEAEAETFELQGGRDGVVARPGLVRWRCLRCRPAPVSKMLKSI